MTHAGRHFRRFPRSLYAPPFRQSLAAMFGTREDGANEPKLTLFAEALSELPAAQQGETLTALAREALRAGHPKLAKAAARAAQSTGTHEASSRAVLYAAAVDAASERAAEALAALSGVEQDGFDADDVRLLAAARETANEVLRAPQQDLAAASGADRDAPPPDETSRFLRQVARSLELADTLLMETKP
jgi:hypothetical protein